MYQNITQLLEEGLFWKRLGRHERAFRYFSEVAEREPGMGRAWTERMESAAIWMGSLTLLREIYGRLVECVRPADSAYPVLLEQAVEFAPDAKAFKAGLIRLQDSGQKPDMFRAIDDMCRELTGDGLDVLLAREADDDLFRTLLAEFHGRRANSAREKEHPPGVIAIHSQIAAECLAGRDAAEAQGMLLNTQNALLLCHQQMEGVARSHGSVIAKTETYSLDERIRVLDKLDRDYSPDDPMILNRIGASHLLLHNSDEAIAVFDRAFAIEKRPKPLINKAAALEQKAWRAFNLNDNRSDAADHYQEGVKALKEASVLPMEKGDASKCDDDLKRMSHLQEMMINAGQPLYPSQLIRDFTRKQREFADQYMHMYRQEGADVGFISKMVIQRFSLRNAEQAMQCAREMLEDFCPGFVAIVLTNLKRHGFPLLPALTSLAKNSANGVMALDAQESIALYILLGGNDVKECAAVARKVSEMAEMDIRQLETWFETYLEVGFGQSVYRFACLGNSARASRNSGRESKGSPGDPNLERDMYNRYVELMSEGRPPFQSNQQSVLQAKGDRRRRKPEKRNPPSGKEQIIIAALFFGVYVLLAMIVPTLLDRIMAPVLPLDFSLDQVPEYTLTASRGRYSMHLLAYVLFMLAPMLLVAKCRGYTFDNTIVLIMLVFVWPVLAVPQGSIFRMERYEVRVTAESIEGASPGFRQGRRQSILIETIDFNRTKNRNHPGLEFVSPDRERILLASSLFHGKDRERVLDHVRGFSAAIPDVPASINHTASEPREHTAQAKSKAPGWAWMWGVWAFPILGCITTSIASVLNKHHQGPVTMLRFTRNASFAVLYAAFGALISQFIVAATLILARYNTGPLFWTLWTAALLVVIAIIVKTLPIALRSQAELQVEIMQRGMWMRS